MFLIPVDNKFAPYCDEMQAKLAQHDIRGFVDDRNETIGKKIRDNELKRIPLLLIIGENEISAGGVSVRTTRRRRSGCNELWKTLLNGSMLS